MAAMSARVPGGVEVGSRVLPFDGTTLGFMHEAPHGSQGVQAMRDALARDGYLLLRGAIPRNSRRCLAAFSHTKTGGMSSIWTKTKEAAV